VDARWTKTLKGELRPVGEDEKHPHCAEATHNLQLEIVTRGWKFVPVTRMLGIRQQNERGGQQNQHKLVQSSQHRLLRILSVPYQWRNSGLMHVMAQSENETASFGEKACAGVRTHCLPRRIYE
jgi:hypothetical protein